MSDTIRILFIIDGLRPGGKERQLLEILKNLDDVLFVKGVITFNSNQHYSNHVKGITQFFKELKKRPSRLKPLYEIWKCFKEFRPDIVHTFDTLSSFYSWLPCKYYRIPIIDGSIRDAGVDRGLNKYFKLFFLKQANKIVSNSYAGLKTYNISGHVIYNAIDKNRFFAPLNNGDFNIIMSANFTDYKDHLTFIKASIKLVQEKEVDHVFLLGDGPHKEKFENLLKSGYSNICDNFHFIGTVENVEEYLAKCSIGVLCSTIKYGEGLSNSILEYMAAGLIAIATNIGGSNEIINHRENGFLICPDDYTEIIRIVKEIKKDSELKEKIIMNAKNTIEKKFHITRNIQKLQSIYAEILDEIHYT